MNGVVLIAKARDFSARKHTSQRRKGSAEEPYVNHTAEVSYLVAEATEGADPELVAAAELHDTVEDTDTEKEEIAAEFGGRVASIVEEVTDDKRLTRAERWLAKIRHAPFLSSGAKILKIADATSNLRSIRVSPPPNWSIERRREYLNRCCALVDRIRGTNEWLEAQFDNAAEALRTHLDAEAAQRPTTPATGP